MISFKKWECPEDKGTMSVSRPMLTASIYACGTCQHNLLVDHNTGEVCELGEGGALVRTGKFLKEFPC